MRKHYGERYIQKDLDIQDPLIEEDDSQEQPPLNKIGSLQDFKSLTLLGISLQMLFGFGLADYSGKYCQVAPKATKVTGRASPAQIGASLHLRLHKGYSCRL